MKSLHEVILDNEGNCLLFAGFLALARLQMTRKMRCHTLIAETKMKVMSRNCTVFQYLFAVREGQNMEPAVEKRV